MTAPASAVREARLPGEEGVWILVFGDLTVFLLFFCTFVYYRGQDFELYRAAELTLNRHLGALNTVLLLTSSWFVAAALQAIRDGVNGRAMTLLSAAIGCGIGFGTVKYFEYGEKLRAGITPATNDFYMYYFVLTGIHFLHVLVGLGVLLWMRARIRRREPDAHEIRIVECGGIYWHMVDLLWVVLFALLYMMR